MDAHSPAVVSDRLAPLLEQLADALAAGIAVSGTIHQQRGWNPDADRHTGHGLVRREAMERLKPFGARLEDADNLGLPMSGLILRSAGGDVVRVWHSEDGELPAATTRPLQAFFRQEPTRQGTLFAGTTADPAGRSNLAVLWDSDGHRLTRLTLVRPAGFDGRHARVDWKLDLLRLLGPDPPTGAPE